MKSFIRNAFTLAFILAGIFIVILTGCAAKPVEPDIGHAQVSAGRVDKTFELQASTIDRLRRYVATGGKALVDTLDDLNRSGLIDSRNLAAALGKAQTNALKSRRFAERETARADAAEGSLGFRVETKARAYWFWIRLAAWSALGITAVAAVGSRFVGGVPGIVLSAVWGFIKHVFSAGVTTRLALARERTLLNSYIDRGSAVGGAQ